MNSIGDFFVEFTTKGLAELKEGLKGLFNSLDRLDKQFGKTTKGFDNFIGSFKRWAKAIGLVWAMNKALKETFNVSDELRNLYKSSDMLGVDPETLERWGIAARAHGGSQSDVNSFFAGLNQMSRNLKEGKYSPELMERMARYGFSEQYLYGASLPENRDKIITDLNNLLTRKDLTAADIQSIQSVFPGLNDTMVSLLQTFPEDLKKTLEWADKQRALTNDPKALQNAIKLAIARIELEQTFKRVWTPLMEPVADLIKALEPLAEPLAELVKSIAELISQLMPVVEYVVKKLGGSATYGADALSALIKTFKGDMSAWKQFEDKYSQPGTGGWLGSAVRGFDWAVDKTGNRLADILLPQPPQDIVIDLDSLPSGATGVRTGTLSAPSFNGNLNARIDLFNNGVKAEQMRWGTYIDPRTRQELGTAAWATSFQNGGM